MMDSTCLANNPFNSRCEYLPDINMMHKQESLESSASKLMKRLQCSMQPEILLKIFHQEISKQLPVCGLTFYGQHQILTITETEQKVSSLSLELTIEDSTLGRLQFNLKQSIAEIQKEYIKQLTQLLTFPLRNALDYQEMKKLAFNDQLTGLANRHHFSIAFKNSIRNSISHRRSFALLVLDLDGFKTVNDKLGHQTGDLVLTTFSQVLSDCLRETDQVFRYGGDEFTIILNDAADASVPQIVERIQNQMAANALLSELNISCSIGSARYQTDDNLYSLFERADRALYRAKNKGDNCLEMSARVALNQRAG